MTNDRELMQQALGALENLQGLCTDADDGWVEAVTIWTPEIIKALRERLEQPEGAIIPHLPGICCKTGTCDREQPVQEPVAWISKNGVVYPIDAKDEVHPINELQPLYTTPPQRKPLTDEDTVALIKQCRDAFAEELGAWDIDPPIHHVQQGYDNCVNWLAAYGIKEKNT